jgi:hypothetical protein
LCLNLWRKSYHLRNQLKQENLVNNTYTIAIRSNLEFGPAFVPAQGIPRNMTKLQAETLAKQAQAMGRDVVAFNVVAE